jgi:hypothetical protein
LDGNTTVSQADTTISSVPKYLLFLIYFYIKNSRYLGQRSTEKTTDKISAQLDLVVPSFPFTFLMQVAIYFWFLLPSPNLEAQTQAGSLPSVAGATRGPRHRRHFTLTGLTRPLSSPCIGPRPSKEARTRQGRTVHGAFAFKLHACWWLWFQKML